MLLKKKRASTNDLSNKDDDPGSIPDDDMGNGLFDRLSAARKTLRGSTRRKKDGDQEDTKSLNEVNLEPQKKSSVTSNWRARLTEKFKKPSMDQESGEPSLNSYRKTSHELDIQTPMTEPTR